MGLKKRPNDYTRPSTPLKDLTNVIPLFTPHAHTVLSRLTSHPCRSKSKKTARPMARIRLNKNANSSKAGNFKSNDHACSDRTNWIKLLKVLGIAPTQPKTVAKQVEQPAKVEVKPTKKLPGIKLLIGGFFLALVYMNYLMRASFGAKIYFLVPQLKTPF